MRDMVFCFLLIFSAEKIQTNAFDTVKRRKRKKKYAKKREKKTNPSTYEKGEMVNVIVI